ncbi:MAG TPA: guanylate kinase [Candidatus Dormibacteraeota bacterium]|nr:guanylate kinase [Candidatus Dormibacteraeota bacterium]
MSGSGSKSRTSNEVDAWLATGHRPFVVVISGPSGVGKSSFVKQLLLTQGLNLEYSVSATTRPRRAHETEGRDYFFLNREEFRRRIDAGEFVEWAEVHGEHYGTLRSEIERRLGAGRNVLLDIDVQGGKSVRRVYKDGVFIFVLPPSLQSLEERLRGRATDSDETIRLRLDNALREINLVSEYDYAVVNDDLRSALDRVASIIVAESCNTSRRPPLVST